MNLIENAIKYVSPGGRIDVSVAAEPDAIVLQVADNGPGIPAADRQRILQPFVRLERDREQVGSGLGLSLVAAVGAAASRQHRAARQQSGIDRAVPVARITVPGEKAGKLSGAATCCTAESDSPGTSTSPRSRGRCLRRVLAAGMPRCCVDDDSLTPPSRIHSPSGPLTCVVRRCVWTLPFATRSSCCSMSSTTCVPFTRGVTMKPLLTFR